MIRKTQAEERAFPGSRDVCGSRRDLNEIAFRGPCFWERTVQGKGTWKVRTKMMRRSGNLLEE